MQKSQYNILDIDQQKGIKTKKKESHGCDMVHD